MTAASTELPKLAPGVGTPRTPPEARDNRPAPRLRALDGLRLVCALMVAAYHYGGRDGEVARAWGASPRVQFPTTHTWFAFGCLGVETFFVISGFVICMSGWGRPLKAFVISRAARLLPAYWAAVLLVAAVFALPWVPYKGTSFSEFLVNLTMLQTPLGVNRVLGVCWTLWAEVRFYALFALCVVMPGASRRRVLMFCGGWMLVSSIAATAHQPFLDAVLMPGYASLFIGGIGLYLLHRDRRDAAAWFVVVLSWLISQHFAVARLWHPVNPHFFSYRPQYGIILAVTFGFVAVGAVALGAFGWANWRWLTVAGALTYPFYLVHEHLGWIVIAVLHRRLGLPSYATVALTVGVMLLLAWVLYSFVEQRLAPVLKRLLTGPTP